MTKGKTYYSTAKVRGKDLFIISSDLEEYVNVTDKAMSDNSILWTKCCRIVSPLTGVRFELLIDA